MRVWECRVGWLYLYLIRHSSIRPCDLNLATGEISYAVDPGDDRLDAEVSSHNHIIPGVRNNRSNHDIAQIREFRHPHVAVGRLSFRVRQLERDSDVRVQL